MSTKSEIVVHFGPEADEPEIVSELEKLTKLHALSIEDLYIRWEQFSYQKHDINTDLSAGNLDKFKQFLQHQMEKKAAKISTASTFSSASKRPKVIRGLNSSPSLFGFSLSKTANLKKRKINEGLTSDDKGDALPLNFSTNSEKDTGLGSSPNTTASELVTASASPLKDEKESGEILDSLNLENVEIAQGLVTDVDNKLKITPFYDPEKYHFRTMRQNLLDVADVLDEQIEMFKTIVQDHYGLSASDFGDPTIQSQSEVHSVGRIVPELSASDEFLNIESLALETSRMGGVGRRIRLDLTNINEVSFFCGQIVALKGKNANSEYFTVSEVLPLPYPDSPVSTSEELHETNMLTNGAPSKIIITSGPYIADDCFSLSHLENFVERMNGEVKPHVLIMFGPFIDISHPMIANGTIPDFPNLKVQPKTLDEVFIKVIAPVLKKIESQIQVILIPSTRDALSKHAAYPQDSLNRKELHLPKNFKCFTNPATFQLNEVFFGCSNVDIFKDLKEITKGGSISMRNRFDRISEHLLRQRRFYPVFPGGTKKKLLSEIQGEKVYEQASGADLEVSYLGLTEFVGNFAPDVIVIPSELQRFARVVQNVVMINPGRFIKPMGAKGTYAQISIKCPNLEDNTLTKVEGESTVFLHNVWKRARVDLATV
ncbi:POL12 (YBL035C) [Zygosaccharomyces parabailii]|nr:POL12 (YBL035C) [Zygosaccharomyces parabailii]